MSENNIIVIKKIVDNVWHCIQIVENHHWLVSMEPDESSTSENYEKKNNIKYEWWNLAAILLLHLYSLSGYYSEEFTAAVTLITFKEEAERRWITAGGSVCTNNRK